MPYTKKETRLTAAIKERRRTLGLTQEQAAKKAGIPWGTWHDLEVGAHKPHELTLRAIARFLAVPAAKAREMSDEEI